MLADLHPSLNIIDSPASGHRWLLKLVRLLQTTLGATELLQLFCAKVTEYISARRRALRNIPGTPHLHKW